MRVILVVACAAAFLFSAWSNMPTSADAKQTASTISPFALMTNVGDLPTEQFDAY